MWDEITSREIGVLYSIIPIPIQLSRFHDHLEFFSLKLQGSVETWMCSQDDMGTRSNCPHERKNVS